jgi:hypothetical protein
MGIDLVAGSPVLLRNFQVNLSALPASVLRAWASAAVHASRVFIKVVAVS